MNRHKAEVATLEHKIQDQKDVLDKKHTLKKYIDQMPDRLAFADDNEEAQMEILKRLGVNVFMYPEGEYKSVDWVLFGKNVSRKKNPSLASHSLRQVSYGSRLARGQT